jgi:hypothetical protein
MFLPGQRCLINFKNVINVVPFSEVVMKRLAIMIAIVSILFFFVRLVPYLERPTGGYLGYYTSGKMLLTHQDMTHLYHRSEFLGLTYTLTGLTSEDFYWVQPPTLSFVFLPCAVLPITTAKLYWEIFSLLCLLGSLYLLQKHFTLTTTESLVFTALAFGFTPIYLTFVKGQVYALLLLLHVLTLKSWTNRNIYLASVYVTLLLVIKGYGVIFLLLALFRREWRLLILTSANYLLIISLSSLLIGVETWIAYFATMKTVIFSFPISATYQQNIQSFIAWFFVKDKWNVHPFFELPFIAQPLIAIFMISGVVFLYRLAKQSRDIQLPFMFAIILGVLTVPFIYDYHYVFLFLPIVACYKQLSEYVTTTETIIFGAATFLLTVKIPYDYPVFQNTWMGIFGFPRVCGAMMIIWLLFRIMKQSRRRSKLTVNPKAS